MGSDGVLSKQTTEGDNKSTFSNAKRSLNKKFDDELKHQTQHLMTPGVKRIGGDSAAVTPQLSETVSQLSGT